MNKIFKTGGILDILIIISSTIAFIIAFFIRNEGIYDFLTIVGFSVAITILYKDTLKGHEKITMGVYILVLVLILPFIITMVIGAIQYIQGTEDSLNSLQWISRKATFLGIIYSLSIVTQDMINKNRRKGVRTL